VLRVAGVAGVERLIFFSFFFFFLHAPHGDVPPPVKGPAGV
jgi:hypothetical protein